MELLFLGTSSGTPTKDRNVSAVALIESQGKSWYLIDCGEGTQHQILHTPLSLNSLSAIFITHVHGDHCYGLPGLLASAGMQGRAKPLTVVAPKAIRDWLISTQACTELYLPFELNFFPSEKLPTLDQGQFMISLTKLSHRVPSYAYSFTERKIRASLDIEKLCVAGIPQGPLWGKLRAGINIIHNGREYSSTEFLHRKQKPRKIVICGDNDSPELLKKACVECDLLVHESTFTDDMAEKAVKVGHSCAKQVASFAEQATVPNLILTHFSPRYQSRADITPSINDIYLEAQSVYRGNLQLASDFKRFELDKTGKLRSHI
ncbi:ribonuclease Z [Microbulbifer sp. VTAC004]|uniref:ribonuclease Z n=1 Tax=unclassified Microbulbifer TaxID=2619833 RepID=UPI00403A037F